MRFRSVADLYDSTRIKSGITASSDVEKEVEVFKAVFCSLVASTEGDTLLAQLVEQQQVVERALSDAREDPRHAFQTAVGVLTELSARKPDTATGGRFPTSRRYNIDVYAVDFTDSFLATRQFNRQILGMYLLEYCQDIGHNAPVKTARSRKKELEPSDGVDTDGALAHILLGVRECLLAFSVPQVRSLPPFRFVQLAHAVIASLRLQTSSHAPVGGNAELNQVDKEDAVGHLPKLRTFLLQSVDKSRPSPTLDTFIKFLDLLEPFDKKLCKPSIKDDAKSGDSITDTDTAAQQQASLTASQGLHLLSEVATSNRNGAGDEVANAVDTAFNDHEAASSPVMSMISELLFGRAKGDGEDDLEKGRPKDLIDDALIERVLSLIGGGQQ